MSPLTRVRESTAPHHLPLIYPTNTVPSASRLRKLHRHTSSSLNADITRLYRAITTNEETVTSLAQRQEDLMQESKTELHMKQELEWEVRRPQESLAFHLREIKNIEIREELRQFQLRELNDLGTVTLVQSTEGRDAGGVQDGGEE